MPKYHLSISLVISLQRPRVVKHNILKLYSKLASTKYRNIEYHPQAVLVHFLLQATQDNRLNTV